MRLPSMKAKECLSCITGRIEYKIQEILEKEQTDVYCFLHDLQKISGFERCIGLLEKLTATNSQSFPRLGNFAISNIIRTYQRCHYFNAALQDEIVIALNQIPDIDMEKPPVSMGLFNGYAGEGMLRLIVLNQKNMSWIILL